MTRELRPCRRCGRAPKLVPYEQSIDGNHDRPARVECRCGARHVLSWEEFFRAREGVPRERRGSGYMSHDEIEAISDAVVEAWNLEQAGRRVMDKSSVTMTADDDWWLERVTMDGEQRYPERIRVGSLENPRVYVPERTCGYPVVTDEEEMAERDRAAREGRIFSTQDIPLCRKCTACGAQFTPMTHRPKWLNHCPVCGARIVEWGD